MRHHIARGRPSSGSPRSVISLLALYLVAAVGPAAWAAPLQFRDGFRDLSAWRTNSAASVLAVPVGARDGVEGGMEWQLPTTRPGIWYAEREVPGRVDEFCVLQVKAWCPEPMAVEVQLATAGEARLYHIARLDRPGWHALRIPVAEMGPFAGFTAEHLAGPLRVRFWVDGAPAWAGGAVPPGKELTLVFSDLSIVSERAGLPDGVQARITVSPDQVAGRIDPHVYGQFLEHIYHSVEDGLFGELVRNRAFTPAHAFRRHGDSLALDALATDVKAFLGDPAWTDYELSLKAQKSGGQEGFLILVRAADERNFYWWNLGGWGNKRHQLEVEVNDARRTLGAPVEGRIETGRWYDIRVRVEGDHLQGWLDGEKLLDLRDGTHPKGGVGVGFWVTTGEFRDIRVADLQGRPLPCALPSDSRGGLVPAGWSAYPEECAPAVNHVPSEASPNTGWVVRVDLAAEPRGIAQGRFDAVKGRRYPGLVRLAVEGKVSRAEVALLAPDGTVLDRQRLKPLAGAAMADCRFTLSPKRSEPEATLALTASGEGVLLIDLVSLTRDDYLKAGCRADLLEAVKALQPPIIRWPGGCFASIYRWKRAVGPQHERKPFYNAPWGEWDSAGFGTDEFIRLCRAVGAEPLIVVNLGSWDDPAREEEYVREALEWIEYCNGDASTPMGRLRAAHGRPEPYGVTHWELDNETWGLGVERYGELAGRVAKAIKERWPGLKLYACTFWEKEDARLLELCGEHVDFISYHFYENPDRYAAAPARFEALWHRYADLIARSPNPEVRLAVTEWNAQSTDWRTGLFAGGYLNVMERCAGVVRMATPALFLRRVDARDWDNAFINHDHRSWFPAPNYVVMKLYRDHFQPLRVEAAVKGALNAVATRSEDGRRLVIKVVNPRAGAVTCLLEPGEPFRAARGDAWEVAAQPTDRNTLDAPDRIAPARRPVAVKDGALTHTFPAHSVTVLNLRRR